MNYRTKIAKVRMALENGEILTSWTAIQRWGATRLSAIIFELRNRYSMDIASRLVWNPETKSSYSEYWLVMPDEMTL